MKYITLALVFLCAAGYVVSLTCLKCNTKKSCQSPVTEKCGEGIKYCASLWFQSVHGKGCMDREDICEQKSSLGRGFDHCSICLTDNCNTYVFP